MIEQGAAYYVNVNLGEETKWVMEKWCPLRVTDDYAIVDLGKDCRKETVGDK